MAITPYNMNEARPANCENPWNYAKRVDWMKDAPLDKIKSYLVLSGYASLRLACRDWCLWMDEDKKWAPILRKAFPHVVVEKLENPFDQNRPCFLAYTKTMEQIKQNIQKRSKTEIKLSFPFPNLFYHTIPVLISSDHVLCLEYKSTNEHRIDLYARYATIDTNTGEIKKYFTEFTDEFGMRSWYSGCCLYLGEADLLVKKDEQSWDLITLDPKNGIEKIITSLSINSNHKIIYQKRLHEQFIIVVCEEEKIIVRDDDVFQMDLYADIEEKCTKKILYFVDLKNPQDNRDIEINAVPSLLDLTLDVRSKQIDCTFQKSIDNLWNGTKKVRHQYVSIDLSTKLLTHHDQEGIDTTSPLYKKPQDLPIEYAALPTRPYVPTIPTNLPALPTLINSSSVKDGCELPLPTLPPFHTSPLFPIMNWSPVKEKFALSLAGSFSFNHTFPLTLNSQTNVLTLFETDYEVSSDTIRSRKFFMGGKLFFFHTEVAAIFEGTPPNVSSLTQPGVVHVDVKYYPKTVSTGLIHVWDFLK